MRIVLAALLLLAACAPGTDQSNSAPDRAPQRTEAGITMSAQEAATVLQDLPVTNAPLQLVVEQRGAILEYFDLGSGERLVIAGGSDAEVSEASVVYSNSSRSLSRWEFADRSTSTVETPEDVLLGAARLLSDGSLAVQTRPEESPVDRLMVFEPNGALRCVLETNGHPSVTSRGDIIVEDSPNSSHNGTSIAVDPTTCREVHDVPTSIRSGLRLGAERDVLFGTRGRADDGLRIVRYEFVNDRWNEVKASERLAFFGVLYLGDGSLWAIGRFDLFRLSTETLEVEAQWPIAQCLGSSHAVTSDDALWLYQQCTNELTRVDFETGSTERYQLPVNDGRISFPRLTAGGLLIGHPAVGYFFSFANARFERLPDWFTTQVREAREWKLRPGS